MHRGGRLLGAKRSTGLRGSSIRVDFPNRDYHQHVPIHQLKAVPITHGDSSCVWYPSFTSVWIAAAVPKLARGAPSPILTACLTGNFRPPISTKYLRIVSGCAP